MLFVAEDTRVSIKFSLTDLRDERVGAAAIFGRKSQTASLPIQATIFSAEMHAIHLAIEIVKDVIHDKFVIFSSD